MSIFYDSTGCDDGPAIVRELEGGDTHPIAVPCNDCTMVELRLMAAAPELLAALEWTLKLLSTGSAPAGCEQAAIAAIAKATGKEVKHLEMHEVSGQWKYRVLACCDNSQNVLVDWEWGPRDFHACREQAIERFGPFFSVVVTRPQAI